MDPPPSPPTPPSPIPSSPSSVFDTTSSSSPGQSPPRKVSKTWQVFGQHVSKENETIVVPCRSTLRLLSNHQSSALPASSSATLSAVASGNEMAAMQDIYEGDGDAQDRGAAMLRASEDSDTLIESSSTSSISDSDSASGGRSSPSIDIADYSEGENSEFHSGDESESDCDVNTDLELYEGTCKKVDEAVLDIYTDFLNNYETKETLKDHLKTFLKYLPQPNNMPKSLDRLFKYLSYRAPSFSEIPHFYCSKCLLLLNSDDDPCEACQNEIKSCFYSFNIEDQVKHYFEHCDLAAVIDKYQENFPSQDGLIRDICDGSEYKRVKTDGKYDLTLLWNTDGVPLSRSSNVSLYPVQAVICEVPPNLRYQFIIVSVLWCDYQKPPMSTLLTPFIKSLNDVNAKSGASWRHPVDGKCYQSKIVAPFACADAPVRADLQNIKSHQSKYACNCCEQKSKRLPLTAHQLQAREAGSKVRRLRRFLFKENGSTLREHDQMVSQGRKAMNEGKDHIQGVKGPSVLELLPYVDLSTVVFPEYMHNICLGTVRQFTELWLTKPGRWYVGDRINELDEIMCELRTPITVGRQPRPLSQSEHYKASEWRNWFLLYSLVVLRGFLPFEFLQHWCLFVMAVYTLLQEEITEHDIQMADVLLTMFVREIGDLYGDFEYVYNVHLMLHLPLCVRRMGPLWASSAFLFESFNGILKKLIHGTKHQAKELSNNLKIAYGVQKLQQKICNNIASRNSSLQPLTPLEIIHLSEQDKSFLRDLGIPLHDLKLFARAKKGSVLFTSKKYHQEKKRSNFTVCFSMGDVSRKYGIINFFCSHEDIGEGPFAVVTVFKLDHPNIILHEESRLKVSHIIPVCPDSTELAIVPMSHIIEKVVRVKNYVCLLPNKYEARNL